MNDGESIQLLHDFQLGHADAFEQVFKLFYKQLRIEAFLILNNEKDAEDQVQQLFLDIWNRQLYRNIQQSLKAYLHTAVRNKCLNHLAKTSHAHKVANKYAEIQYELVEEEGQVNELPPYLQRALGELPVQRLQAFKLVYMEDHQYREAAKEMGISINSLKSHLKLALKFLRMRLQR
jgi:RNA polymerase sigma-70 factor (ECF subfamily)